VILAAAAFLILPAPGRAQLAVATNNPHPTLCEVKDTNRLRGGSLGKAPEIQATKIIVKSDSWADYDPGKYEMRLAYCADGPGHPCLDAKGNSVTGNWKYNNHSCSSRECSWPSGWTTPRNHDSTIHYKVHIFDKATNSRVTKPNQSKLLSVTWKWEGECPQQKQPGSRSLTLTVNNATCTVREGERKHISRSAADIHGRPAPAGSSLNGIGDVHMSYSTSGYAESNFPFVVRLYYTDIALPPGRNTKKDFAIEGGQYSYPGAPIANYMVKTATASAVVAWTGEGSNPESGYEQDQVHPVECIIPLNFIRQ
jgi:hypothetical protein